jgi:aromatase
MSGHTDNEIFISAPFDVVWEVANDVAGWTELFADEYADVDVLHAEPDRIVFRLTTVPKAGRSWSWTSERCLDRERGTVQARRTEPGPFRYLHIFQSFTRLDDGIVLRWVQDFEMRPGAPLTDEQMRELIDAGCQANLVRHRQACEARAAAEAR